jgi:ferredoxin
VGAGVVKLSVDADQCTGHGRCYRMAPDLLTFDDEGYVTLRGDSVEVPEGQLAAADEAAGSCPEGAISLIDD